MPLITRKELAVRHSVNPRTVDRRQKDPNYPKSRIIRGYHYFDLDEVEAYERALAGAPRIPKASPIARPSSNHADATAREAPVNPALTEAHTPSAKIPQVRHHSEGGSRHG